jgi:hypothetical protein
MPNDLSSPAFSALSLNYLQFGHTFSTGEGILQKSGEPLAQIEVVEKIVDVAPGFFKGDVAPLLNHFDQPAFVTRDVCQIRRS